MLLFGEWVYHDDDVFQPRGRHYILIDIQVDHMNQHQNEESPDSHINDKVTSGSDRIHDSESASGWGSDEDMRYSRLPTSSSLTPSYREGE